MIRYLASGIAAMVLLATVPLAAPAPAAASLLPMSGGMRLDNADGSGCSVSFADPVTPWLIYTAAHCYEPGISRVVSNRRQPVGVYRPDLVYDLKLDVVAIQLYNGVDTRYMQCDEVRCYSLGPPRAPQLGDYVCKFGSVTRETCGRVVKLWADEFAVRLSSAKGDSGGPVYQIDSDGIAHLVGVTTGQSRRDRANAYATKITSIAALLQRTFGVGWSM